MWEGLMGTKLASVIYLYASTSIFLLALLALANRVIGIDLTWSTQLFLLVVVVGAEFAWARQPIPNRAEWVRARERRALDAGRELKMLAPQVAELRARISKLSSATQWLNDDFPSRSNLRQLMSEMHRMFQEAQEVADAGAGRFARNYFEHLEGSIHQLASFVGAGQSTESLLGGGLRQELSQLHAVIRELVSVTKESNRELLTILRDYEDRAERRMTLREEEASQKIAEEVVRRLLEIEAAEIKEAASRKAVEPPDE
jgi:hypothetical protein